MNVVTKSGENAFHGSLFEFLRNTSLDSVGFFSPERGAFQQNQYGGTFGGPLRKDKTFLFSDYQGQRTVQGMETGLVSVPSLANRAGDFSDSANTLSGTVNGDYLAQTLASRLGYSVLNGEPFYTANCTLNNHCVFPNAFIPRAAFAVPATRMLQYFPCRTSVQISSLPEPRNAGFTTTKAQYGSTKTRHGIGTLSLYYLADRYNLDDPYPSGFGRATVPSPTGPFNAISNGLDQVAVFSHTIAFGSSAVNEARVSFTRLNNNLGAAKGGVGVSLADQGLSNGPFGIKQGFQQQAGVELLYFNSFALGTNPCSLLQVNNTYQAGGSFSKVVGNHTIKIGGQLSSIALNNYPTWLPMEQSHFLDQAINPPVTGSPTSFSDCPISARSSHLRPSTRLRPMEGSSLRIAGVSIPASH